MKVFVVLLAAFLNNACIADAKDSYEGWAPPGYCSTKEQLLSRAPQPLTEEELRLSPKLLQVQVLSRHGARAPYGRMFCWSKAKSPVDAPWLCGTDAVVSRNIIEDPHHGKSYGRLYRKKFTAGHNILSGTCPVGALLPQGLEQLRLKGKLLREAYVGKDDPTKLFESAMLSSEGFKEVYLRSDDEERTIASGMALIDEMFPIDTDNPQIMPIWHVADYSTDIINTNTKICPRLDFINDQFQNSSTHIEFVTSKETIELEARARKVLGDFDWGRILECLMIARCNDMSLPDGMTPTLFDEIISHVERSEFLKLTYMDSWFSKVNMQPLLSEVLWRMGKKYENLPDASKFVLFTGHDSTLMPFVAAIAGTTWDGKWSPYAGNVIFELYEIRNNSNAKSHAVRTLLNGKPLRITGCSEDLCEYHTFRSALSFAFIPRDCSSPQLIPTIATQKRNLSHDHMFGVGLALCFLVGCAAGYVVRQYDRISYQSIP